METLLKSYCFQTAVTCAEAEEQSSYIRRMPPTSRSVPGHLSCWDQDDLLQKVVTHPAKGLVDETNAVFSHRSSRCKPFTPSCCVLPVGLERWERRNSRGHPMVWSSVLMEQLNRNMAAKKPLMRGLRRWLDLSVGWAPSSLGFLLRGCPCSRCSQREKLHAQWNYWSAWPITACATWGSEV